MRNLVSEDFIFLDADTLVVRSIDKLWNMKSELALSADMNDGSGKKLPEYSKEIYRACGWKHPPLLYFNTGVMLVRSTQKVFDLFNHWHGNWSQQVQITSVLYDQESFAHSLSEVDIITKTLSFSYNNMISITKRVSRSTSIIHYFITMETWDKNYLVTTQLLESIANEKKIEWTILDKCIIEGHPWAKPEPWLLVHSGMMVRSIIMKIGKQLSIR